MTLFHSVARFLIAIVFIQAAFDKLDDPTTFIDQQLQRTQLFITNKLHQSITFPNYVPTYFQFLKNELVYFLSLTQLSLSIGVLLNKRFSAFILAISLLFQLFIQNPWVIPKTDTNFKQQFNQEVHAFLVSLVIIGGLFRVGETKKIKRKQ